MTLEPPAVARLTDGEWHRLHPASPLLKGGIAFIAILGIVIANLRERIIGLFLPQFDNQGNPVDYVVNHGFALQALAAIAVVLIVFIFAFYLSWRMHSFRITNEVVEVRSGILFRTNRKARLDRIQGINIVRPFFARLFGAAKLEISQAGHDANLQLSYLGSAAADDLRRDILRLASGSRASAAPAAATRGTSVIDRRVNELLAPELHPDEAPPQSVVRIHLGRLLGSIVFSFATVTLVVLVVLLTIWVTTVHDLFPLFVLLPGLLGFGSYYFRRFTRSLRYTIAGTPDGVRVGFGLLSTSNETLPPGRIHSVEVRQQLLWRPAGWWEIRVNRASHSSSRGAANQANTTILPVGNLSEVARVLELMLPELVGADAVALVESGLVRGGADPFRNSPRRAILLRPFSWWRNGLTATSGSFVLRKGFVWRRLVIVPQARLQSVSLHQGPVHRMLRLASIQLHTVAGPIRADIDAVDQQVALEFFEEVASSAVRSAQLDTSHRWRSAEAETLAGGAGPTEGAGAPAASAGEAS
ncbi:PH domain-containing protein [soil metagenome]